MEDYLMLRAFSIELGYIFKRVRVGNSEGIYFVIHTNENAGHNRPHLHASYQDKEIIISLDNHIEIIGGNIGNKKNNKALEFVIENLTFLQNNWNRFSNGIRISESDFMQR